MYIGTGINRTNQLIHSFSIRQGTADSSQTDMDMSNATLNIVGAVGTGAGLGGDIILKVAKAGTNGTTPNTLINAFVLKQDGNVGIGVPSPNVLGGKLQISSSTLNQTGVDVNIPAANNAYGVYSESFIGVYGRNTSGNGYGVQGYSVNSIGVYGSSSNSIGGFFVGLTGSVISSLNSASSSTALLVRNSNNYPILVSKGDGLVGLGIVSPSASLHIIANTNSNNALRIDNSLFSNIFRIDNSGNVTSNSYIKLGGTSAQFLKADGSVDTTIYLTQSNAYFATSPLILSGQTFSILQSSATQNGFLSSIDWNTFNNKQPALGYTPYNSTNPAGYITQSALIGYLTASSLLGYVPYTGSISDVYLGNNKLYVQGSINFGTASDNITAFGNTRIAQGSSMMDIGEQSAGSIAIWANQATNTSGNYSFQATSTNTSVNGSTGVQLRVGGNNRITLTNTAFNAINLAISAAGSVTNFNWLKPTNTNQTSGAMIPGWRYDAGSRQWATGNIATQIEVDWLSASYSFVASSTITDAYGHYFRQPFAGTNAAITRNWAAGFAGNIEATGFFKTGGTSSQFLKSDGSVDNNRYILNFYKDTVDSTNVTATASEILLKSVLVPANTFTIGDVLYVKSIGHKTGTAGTQTLRIRTNTVNNLTGTPTILSAVISATNTLFSYMQRTVVIKSATSSTQVNNANMSTDEIASTTARTLLNIDWTVNQYIIATVQNSSTADTSFLSFFSVDKF